MSEGDGASRILFLLELIKRKTDDRHWLTVRDIMEQYEYRFGHPISRNTVKSLIRSLQHYGVDIQEEIRDRGTSAFSFQHHLFEPHELRMLIDAVSAFRSLPLEDTNTIIEKLHTLTSEPIRETIRRKTAVWDSVKTDSRHIKYYLHTLHEAIEHGRAVSFQYGGYNEKMQFQLRHDGKRYDRIPLAVVWHRDYYYLVARRLDDQVPIHYRIDRMRNVVMEEQTFKPVPFDIQTHLQASFHMYPGKAQSIEIHFHRSLLNVMTDRFGTGIHPYAVDENWFSLRTSAAVNEGLLRWLLAWGSQVRVIGPGELVVKIRQELDRTRMLYD
ncbi:helix-turn-helix transcriptional regulator [Paenibacillus ginsengarvi]|uniref:WYL domain-containing protein n=1 Tax=Paenibacillus ginsengarvi TaxID=400777 RepID=A0A3B0CKN2_9BACL|nr:WYL domain-containing protein [Paenibacillus ginsengarvi]RKN84897.1 WYL domain-containing protein [Paenibacillus ginsengarvi]